MRDYLKLFETQSGQVSETSEKASPLKPTKPTKPGSVGFVGLPSNAFTKVLTNEATLSADGEVMNTLQNRLPALPTKPTKPDDPKPCDRCGAAMETSGPYHFWCAMCGVDVQLPVPPHEKAGYCRIFHDPLVNGVCVASADIPHDCLAQSSGLRRAA